MQEMLTLFMFELSQVAQLLNRLLFYFLTSCRLSRIHLTDATRSGPAAEGCGVQSGHDAAVVTERICN
jgi:hypothetical protein